MFAIQIKLADFSPTALRVTQIGIAMLGIVLIVAAVHDLAGPRASRLAAWLLVLEPASIFFNSELHKEPLMELASGLVVFGGTKIWKRLDLNGFILCALGGLIAIETRSYAGWFLVSAAVLLTLHAALRRLDRPWRAMPIVYAVALIVFLATPTLLSITSKASLQRLQQAQNFTTQTQAASGNGGPNSDNLAFESVDFSTRGAVIRNLPQRVFDLIFRPYPWQLQDTSQRLGAVGSVIALAVLALLLAYAWRSRGQILTLTAPILYPLVFLLIAYSLSAGNAGTGFRYRTHLVVLAIAMLVVLREHVLQARAESAALSADVRPRPARLEPRARLMPAQLRSHTYDPMSVAPDSTGQQDLSTYLRIFWRWKFLLLAFVVLIPLAVYVVERSKPKVYQSSTLVELQDVSPVGGHDRRARS